MLRNFKPESFKRLIRTFSCSPSRYNRNATAMFFDDVQKGVPDAMYHLKVQADGDSHPKKVDLGVGVYRNEQGAFHELRAVTKVCDLQGAGNEWKLTSAEGKATSCGNKPQSRCMCFPVGLFIPKYST